MLLVILGLFGLVWESDGLVGDDDWLLWRKTVCCEGFCVGGGGEGLKLV